MLHEVFESLITRLIRIITHKTAVAMRCVEASRDMLEIGSNKSTVCQDFTKN